MVMCMFMDWETSGLIPDGWDMLSGPQGISFGGAVVDTADWRPVDTVRFHVQFDVSRFTWSDEAQAVHGLDIPFLSKMGLPFQNAANVLIDFCSKHWVIPEARILVGGHNTQFDLQMTRQLLKLGGRERSLRFTHGVLDSNTVGELVFGMRKSDDLFRMVGIERTKHDALDDALASLEVFRVASERIYPMNADAIRRASDALTEAVGPLADPASAVRAVLSAILAPAHGPGLGITPE